MGPASSEEKFILDRAGCGTICHMPHPGYGTICHMPHPGDGWPPVSCLGLSSLLKTNISVQSILAFWHVGSGVCPLSR